MKAWHEGMLLLAACALLFLTGTGDIPFYTRGEPREGLVVREMLRSGEWLVPARPGGDLARKPPLFYWSAAATLSLAPDRPERAIRLPSAVLATAGVLATWAAARRALPAGAALPAALVLATSFEWTRAATSARVDMALAAPLAVLLAVWSVLPSRPAGGRAGLVALAIVATALGTLGKGPVALVLPALVVATLLALPRHRAAVRSLHPMVTIAGGAVVAALWYVAAFMHHGAGFLDVVARENFFRFVDTDAAGTGHTHGPFYLVLLGLVGLLPWTPLLSLALAAPRSPATALATAWVGTGLVFFVLAASKRSVYLLPLYPAVAMLLGGGMTTTGAGRATRIARVGAHTYPIAFLLFALVAAAIALGVDVGALVRPFLRPADADGALAVGDAARGAGSALLLLAVGTTAAALAAWRAAGADAWRRLALIVAAVLVAWTAFFDGVLHPAIGERRSVHRFLAHVDTIVPADATLHARFPPDPELRFYAPRDLAPWPDARAVGGYVLLWEDEWRGIRDGRGVPLDVVAVSDTRRSRRGHLALVRAPAGPVRATREVEIPPALPGLRATD